MKYPLFFVLFLLLAVPARGETVSITIVEGDVVWDFYAEADMTEELWHADSLQALTPGIDINRLQPGDIVNIHRQVAEAIGRVLPERAPRTTGISTIAYNRSQDSLRQMTQLADSLQVLQDNNNDQVSKYWMWSAIVLAILLLVIGIYLYVNGSARSKQPVQKTDSAFRYEPLPPTGSDEPESREPDLPRDYEVPKSTTPPGMDAVETDDASDPDESEAIEPPEASGDSTEEVLSELQFAAIRDPGTPMWEDELTPEELSVAASSDLETQPNESPSELGAFAITSAISHRDISYEDGMLWAKSAETKKVILPVHTATNKQIANGASRNIEATFQLKGGEPKVIYATPAGEHSVRLDIFRKMSDFPPEELEDLFGLSLGKDSYNPAVLRRMQE